jgi:hypothetical protein
MTTSVRAWLIGTALALALLAPATASAATDLPVGESKGVRLVVRDGAAVLIFSKSATRLRERLASRYAWISCTELGGAFISVGSGNLDAPGHNRRVRTGFGASDSDFCRLYIRAHTIRRRHETVHVARRILVSIPITQAGAIYLDEESKALRMFRVSLIADFVQSDRKLPGHPTYAQLVETYPQITKVVVELAAPGDTPSDRRVGYYSDGHEHTAVVAVSTLGRRLFFELAADHVLSTNVAVHIFGDRL